MELKEVIEGNGSLILVGENAKKEYGVQYLDKIRPWKIQANSPKQAANLLGDYVTKVHYGNRVYGGKDGRYGPTVESEKNNPFAVVILRPGKHQLEATKYVYCFKLLADWETNRFVQFASKFAN